MKQRHLIKTSVGVAVTALALLLTACGGGGGGSGASAGGSSQTATGTVTGFGSVFVDGVELENSKAATVVETRDGFVNAALKLGQHVEVIHDSGGTATQVTVGAAVIGLVGTVGASNLTVAGQNVTVNTDNTLGPVTVFGGSYTDLTSVKSGDLVEVHGSPVFNTTTNQYDVAATRIEPQAAGTPIRVVGKLASLDTTAKTFAINGLTVKYDSTTTVVPSGSTLANDQTVVVWSASAATASTTITAKRIRVANGPKAAALPSGTAQFGGVVSNLGTGSFDVDGISVTYDSTTTILPATRKASDIKNSSYVQVAGVFGADGKLAATSIRIREVSTTDDTAKIKLVGPVTSWVDANSFVVRDVPVDATGVTTTPAACVTGNGIQVEVVAHAQAGTNVVVAEKVNCPSAPPKVVLFGAKGTASAVALSSTDSTTGTFVITGDRATTITWNSKTTFSGTVSGGAALSPDNLNGVAVIAEGYVDSTTKAWVANEVRTVGTRESDAFTDATKWKAVRDALAARLR